jgi:hypothetical protein
MDTIKEIKKFRGKKHKDVWIIDPRDYWQMLKNPKLGDISVFGSLNLPNGINDILNGVKIVIKQDENYISR